MLLPNNVLLIFTLHIIIYPIKQKYSAANKKKPVKKALKPSYFFNKYSCFFKLFNFKKS